jgi:peptidoglycan/xylan/chitin deacetylase (PgdA/CDA1 family)
MKGSHMLSHRHRPIAPSFCALALAATALHAGPVTTVPWNGYPGAVSFTYDDARKSQIPTLMPQLDALSIKATFFLTYGAGGDLSTNKAKWIAAAKNGHELANHTYDHANVFSGTTQIKKMADDLRGFDASVEAVTFAYPNCSVGAPTEVNAQAFMGRGCGGTSYAWGNQPADWNNIQGQILNAGAPGPGVTAIDGAKSGNKWVSMIVHDVTASPDQYSLTPADNKKLLDAAIADKVWIAPYGTVGAYYRAHFAMDAVTVTGGSPWNLSWTSPHAKMPKSVKLKVKLAAATFGNSFTVSQDGTTIPANADGSYTIDFMKLKLKVSAGTTGIASDAFEAATLRRTSSGIRLTGIVATPYTFSVTTLNGRVLVSKRIDGGQDESIPLASELARSPAIAVLSAKDGSRRAVSLAPVW